MSTISCKLGILSRPDASALLTQGETTVLVGVYGPIEVKPQNLQISKASVEVCYRPKAGLPGIGDKLYEYIIQNICEAALVSVLYPRSSILVVIQEIQEDGGLIACAVNACCLALLSSGIDTKFLIASVSCAIDNNDTLHLNPDKLVWQDARATFVFVFDNINQRIIASHTSGSFSVSQYQDALELCKNGTKEVFEFYKSVISKEIAKEL